MTTLDNIETRVKSQSRNVSHEGIGIDAIHDMYMDYLQNKTAVVDIAFPMADAIKTVMSTQTLTTSENVRLTNALTGIIGDVDLAEAYVGQQAADASPGGDGDPRGNGGPAAGFNGIRPIDEGVVEKVDEEGESGYNETVNIDKFDFGKYLKSKIGNPPNDMVDPHAHHILFKKGLGPSQQALVQEGQAILRRYGIDPIFGLENLVWAPYRITGQHDIKALRNVVEQLNAVVEFGGDYEYIRGKLIKRLSELGKLAARRR